MAIEINHLRVFFEVAKDGSFTEAAKRLHISQSALSRSVSLLEEANGAQLLQRSRHGVSLTSSGKAVFRECEYLFQIADKIEAICRGTEIECKGPFHFAAADHVANYLLPAEIQKFREEFPAVIPGISIGTPDAIVQLLMNTECEFGLMFAKVNLPQLEYEPLHDEPMVLVVSPQLWKKNRSTNHSSTLARVLEKAGYLTSVGAHRANRSSRVMNELFGKIPNIAVEVDGQEAQKRLCLAGAGIAYLSRFMVADEIEKGALHEIPVDHPHSLKLWLVQRKGHAMSQPARLFIESLKSSLGTNGF